ncbi:phage tail sheath C-terminal domain-containing protein [Streptomyces lavendulae]
MPEIESAQSSLQSAESAEVQSSAGSNAEAGLAIERTLKSIEKSVRESTQWAGSEPHDDKLQTAVRQQVHSFLASRWRSGHLVGKTPEEGFYVVCDETNNPPEIVAEGKVVIDFGVALLKAGEFSTFQIVHELGSGPS